ncbi:MAG: T9SS type A sorting domain-containing protein [Bacteroidetes bacterium]|nr:T9SS type A sorting domain-containing protein [Bacteroidota bacterium]MBT7095237.1 T9SS type A sorting domain-containing protein [Bacteroidota bacterium]MBT7463366.1 T9SS type A sorting domain-containing protein [Bacteroidota bacterium]
MLKYLYILLALLSPMGMNAFGQERVIVLEIQFSGNIQEELRTATLKYNKQFAFSFTFDDGLDDAFSLGFPLLNGGHSSEDNNDYPGLYYTDGCGKRITFTAGLAWFTANSAGTDLHNGNSPSNMTWSQALQLYHAGWDIFNHSYDHKANQSGIDYNYQLSKNAEVVKSRLGIDLHYVIPPGGDSDYIEPAFAMGANAVFTSSAGQSPYGNEAVIVDNEIDHTNPVFWRNSITSSQYTSGELKQLAVDRFSDLEPDKHIWWNEFTHRVKYEQIGGSVKFLQFKEYLDFMANQYGEAGLDNGWFASSIEVYEYLIVRDKLHLDYTISNNRLSVRIDYSDCPLNLRYYDISLLFTTDKTISSLQIDQNGQTSYNKQDGEYLINISLPDSHFAKLFENIDNEDIWDIVVYPIPAKQQLFFYSNKPVPHDASIVLTGLSGVSMSFDMQNAGFSEFSANLEGKNIVPGIYLLQIVHDGSVLDTKKIIIQ